MNARDFTIANLNTHRQDSVQRKIERLGSPSRTCWRNTDGSWLDS
jgi:hypothetical protein